MGEFWAFLIDKECIKNVHKLIISAILAFKGDAEKFYPEFCKCVSNAENPFDESLNKDVSLSLGFEAVNHILVYLSGGFLKKTQLSNLNTVLQISVTKKSQLCFV